MDQNAINKAAAEALAKGTHDKSAGRWETWTHHVDDETTINVCRDGEGDLVKYNVFRNYTERLGVYVPGRKYYYLFLGNAPSQIFCRSYHFVVESEVIWTLEERAIGKVIGKNSNVEHELGLVREWCHPAIDAAHGL